MKKMSPGEQLKLLRNGREKLRDLSPKGRMAAAQQAVQQDAQEQTQKRPTRKRYYTLVAKEVRVDGIPGVSLLILEKSTDKIVGEIKHGMFKNYGIPDAEWNGETLEIGGKVFLKYR